MVNIFKNCGLIGDETIPSLRDRFMKEIGFLVPPEIESYRSYYDAWVSGSIEIEGAKLHRGVELTLPGQLPEGYMDGVYWTKFGGNK